MTKAEFLDALSRKEKPASLSTELQALWEEKAGHWEAAHDLVDSLSGINAAWVHAYLHRVEGDQWNANYWYSRAQKSMPSEQTLAEEWENLVEYFLAHPAQS